MTPKQRAQTALAGGKPDRVPFVPAVDDDYICKAAGRELWEFRWSSGEECARIQEAFFARHPCDVWPCWGSPSHRSLAQREVLREGGHNYCLDKRTGRRWEINWRGDLIDADGKTVILGDGGEVIDEKAAAIWVAGNGYPRAVEVEADIEELLGPVPPESHWIEDGFLDNIRYLLPRHGDEYLLVFPLNTLFADVLDLFGGFQEGLVALHTKRALFHKGMEAIVAHRLSRLRAGAAIGAPAAWMIEYCGGADTISRRMFQEFIFPYERELAREVHRLGLQVYLWFLGDPMPFLPDLARVEVDGLYPEQGRKQYSVDIVEMRRQVGDRLCLIGFNDETDLLEGNRAALEREIERQIRGAGSCGAFMMGNTYLAADTPVEHFEHYIEAVHRLGTYAPAADAAGLPPSLPKGDAPCT